MNLDPFVVTATTRSSRSTETGHANADQDSLEDTVRCELISAGGFPVQMEAPAWTPMALTSPVHVLLDSQGNTVQLTSMSVTLILVLIMVFVMIEWMNLPAPVLLVFREPFVNFQTTSRDPFHLLRILLPLQGIKFLLLLFHLSIKTMTKCMSSQESFLPLSLSLQSSCCLSSGERDFKRRIEGETNNWQDLKTKPTRDLL